MEEQPLYLVAYNQMHESKMAYVQCSLSESLQAAFCDFMKVTKKIDLILYLLSKNVFNHRKLHIRTS